MLPIQVLSKEWQTIFKDIFLLAKGNASKEITISVKDGIPSIKKEKELIDEDFIVTALL